MGGRGQKWARDSNFWMNEWMNEFSWFFACLYTFRKVKSYLNSYWVGMVKYVFGLLGHGTLKSAASQEWIDELVDFWTCFIKLIFFDKFYVAHTALGDPAHSSKGWSPSPLLAIPKRFELQIPPNWDRWLNTIMVWNAYLSKIQTDRQTNSKTSTNQALSEKFGLQAINQLCKN